MTTPNILERVRKLLAQANGDGVTEGEADAFAAKAAELMARHGVEQAMLDAHRDPADDPMTHTRIPLDRPYPHERGLLLSCVGYPLNVAVYWNSSRATLVGRRSDVERTEQLYTALLLHVAAALARPVDTTWCYDGAEAGAVTRAHRKAWLTGFAHRIGERMWQMHQRAVEENGTPGAALVLADRYQAAKSYGAELFPRSRTHRARKLTDGGAYRAGVLAADKAEIGQSSVGGRRRALGGDR